MPVIPSIVLSGGSLVGSGSAALETIPPSTFAPPGLAYPPGNAQVSGNCIPILGPALDILAALTDIGRNLIARELVEGLSFRVIGFRVGRGGYNPSIPIHPTPLDTAALELEDLFYPVVSLPPAAIARYEQPTDASSSFLCRVASADAIAGLGEIGVYAEILASPLSPSEVGDIHLFAIAHRPMIGKTLQDVLVARMIVTFA